MLGSTSIEMTVEEEGQKKVIVFSGDLGPRGAPLHRDSVPFKRADYVFMESTYGDRDHASLEKTAVETREVVKKAVETRRQDSCPHVCCRPNAAFVVLACRRISPPHVVAISNIYRQPDGHRGNGTLSQTYGTFRRRGIGHATFGRVARETRFRPVLPDRQRFARLNDVEGPCMIMAGAGMCTGGRILHHFRYNLARPNTTVLIVGYQGHGSLGRMLVDKKKSVRIFGETIPVRASVHTFGGLSGHAGQSDLVRWLGSIASSKPHVFLTHGEARGRDPLKTNHPGSL